MKSLNRLFGRKSSRKVNRRSPFRLSRPIGYASHVERLEDRTLLASNILASLESSVNQPNDTTELVLNVGPGSSPTLGFEVRAAANSVFDPAAIQIFDANTNAVIPLDLSENDHNGSTNSLVLATLNPGEFRIEVRGQTSATGGFIVDVFLPGDADASGSVSDNEYRHALAASYQHMFGFNHVTAQALVQQLGLDPRTNFYSEEMDSDRDGDVDDSDLRMINSNRNIPAVQFELIGDQDPPQIIAGLQVDSGVSNSDGITNDLTILGNISDESLITQFKVGLDEDALVDFVDILPQVSDGANGGSFTLTRSWIETNLNGGNSLEGGTHTLSFFAQDEHDNNNVDSFFDVTFELDVTDPTLTGTQITNQNEDEDFGSLDLGSLTDFFNQNGGTSLVFQVDSITNPIVTVDFTSGNLVLNSVQDAFGSTDIVIQAMDLAGNSVLSNLFMVDVDALNDAPVAIDDVFTTDEDTAVNGASSVFAANPTTPDSDVENDLLTVTEINGNAASVGNQITLASGALLTLNSNGTFTYDPSSSSQFNALAVNETAMDSFSYTIDDGNGGTDTATVTITINGVNDPPVAEADGFTTDEDTSTGGDLFNDNGSGADSDPDTSDSFTITEVNGESGDVNEQIILTSGATLTVNANGTFSYDPSSSSQFNALAVNETAMDSFSYTIDDGNGGTDTATVTITINGVNDPPIAEADGFTTDEDTSTGGDLFNDNGSGADSDPDTSDSFTITEVNGESGDVNEQIILTSGATLTVNANGTFSYDPSSSSQFNALAVNETAMDSFSYTIDDGNGGTDTATVTITINGVNDPPVAEADGFTTDEDTSTGGDLFNDNGSGADSDPDTSDSFTITEVNGESGDVNEQIILTSGATLTVNANGTFSYDPSSSSQFNALAVNETAMDSFSYTIDDGNGGTDTATVTITINGVNDPPIAEADGFTTDEDTSTGGDLFNDNGSGADSDPDTGASFTITEVNGESGDVNEQIILTSGATLTVNANGTFSYDPSSSSQFNALAVNETAMDSFSYTIDDGNGGTDTATVTITINGVNDPPVAEADGFTTDEDTSTGGDLFNDNGSGADSDPDTSDSFTITEVNGESGDVNEQIILTSGATLTVNANGTFSYDPSSSSQFNALAVNETAMDSFSYTIDDGNGGTDTATVTITINGVNDPPVAEADGFTTDEDTSTGGDLFNDNGSGADSDPDTSDSFTITEVNGESGDVNEQIILTSGATLTVNANGTFSYDPSSSSQFNALAVNETAMDSFSYTIDDGNGGTDTATVTITINGVNDPPIAEADGFTTDEDTSTGGDLFNDNGSGADSDPDTSDSFTITEVNGESGDVNEQIILTSGATLTVNANGTFSYDPSSSSQFNALAVNETAMDSFSYTIDDGNGGTDTATVTITINGVNDPPVAEADGFTTDEDTSTGGDLFNDNGSGADSDPDTSDSFTITEVNGESGDVNEQIILTSGATLTVNANGTFSYDPSSSSQFNALAVNETAMDSFSYTIDDGNGGTDTATVTITITGVNDPPVAVDDAVDVNKDFVFNGDVFANNGSGVDSDPDTNDSFSVSQVNENSDDVGKQITLPNFGALLTLNLDGTFEYDPNGKFNHLSETDIETDTFTYQISDGNGGFDTAIVTVIISANQLPIADNDDGGTTDEETPLNINIGVGGSIGSGILGNDTDPDGLDSAIIFSSLDDSTSDKGATLNVNGGVIEYDPSGQFDFLAAGEQTTDTFNYTIEDPRGGTDTATVTVTITGVNDPPVAEADGFTTDEDTSTGGDLFNDNGSGADSDPDTSDSFTITEVNGESGDVNEQIILTSGATLTVNANGTFSYDPSSSSQFNALAVNETAMDSFSYTIDDGNGGTDTATVTITINGVNDPPVAEADGFTTDEDTSTGGDLFNDNGSGADSDPDTSDSFTITEVNGESGDVNEQIILTSGATLTVNANGTFSYDPSSSSQFNALAVNETAMDSFSYTIDDGNGGTDTATVTITINGVNDPPVAEADGFTTDEDTSTGGDLFNDNGSGADSDPDTSDSFTITEVNGESGDVNEQIILTSGATLTVNANGTFSYDPSSSSQFNALAVNETAMDSFSYTIDDGNGGTDTATVTITINGVNDPPVAEADGFTTDEDTSTGGDLFNDNGSGADSDPDTSDSFTITEVNGESGDVNEQIILTSGATLTVNANGTFSYDPSSSSQFNALAVNETAMDSFSYTIDDGNGGTDTATVTITINGVNDPPIAEADGFTTDEDTSTGGDLFNDNGSGADSDPDTGASFTITEVNGESGDVNEQIILTSGATLTVNANGTFSYDPSSSSQFNALAVNETAMDSFSYTIDDGNGGTDTATVTITINGVNDPPVAEADGFTTDEDTSTGGDLFNDNGSGADSDPDTGASFTITEVNGESGDVNEQIILTSGATLTVNANGTFSYDPSSSSQFNALAVNETAMDSFSYTIDDGNGGTDTATVTITINGVNDPPVAEADGFTTDEDTSTGGDLFNDNGSGADSDPDTSDSFTITEVNGESGDVNEQIILTSGATLTVNANGTFSYDPSSSSQFNALAVNETAMDSFSYTIDDGNGGTDTATVTITINGVNDPPVAEADGFTTDEDTSTGGDLFNDNGSGADSDPDTSDSFTITEVNGESGDVNEQIILTSGATLTVNANGTFSYDPSSSSQFNALAVNETAMDSFSYTIDDGNGGTDTATVTITINGVNDPVTANDDAVTTDRNTSVDFDVRIDENSDDIATVADTDPDTNDMLTVISIDGEPIDNDPETNTSNMVILESGAIVTLNPDGTLTYNPNGVFDVLTNPLDSLPDMFEYTISDGNGSTDTAEVDITVTGANEELMIDQGLPDISSDGLTTTVIDLTDVFKDDDPGDTISYEIVPTTLADGNPLPANIWVDTVSIAGVGSDELHITYNPYSSGQVRLPVKITVKATSSDNVSAPVETSFILTPDPQQTVDIQLVSRATAASGRDFTYFRAENFESKGAGLFHLVNGSQGLEYQILLDEFPADINHLGTATINDNLKSVRIIDSNNPTQTLFTIFEFGSAGDNPTIDLTEQTLSGTWSDIEGLNSAIIDKLYNGDLVVRVEFDGTGGNRTLGGGNILVSPEIDQITDLPAEQNEFVVGENYVVEVWISDQLAQTVLAGSTSETAGLQTVQLDLLWNEISTVFPNNFEMRGTDGFFSFVEPPIEQSGKFDAIKGLTLNPSRVEGGYVRIGFAKFIAIDTTAEGKPVEYTIDSEGDGAIGRGSSRIDFSQISISGASVIHSQPAPLHGTESVTTSQELTEGTAVDLVVVRNQTDLSSSGSVAALPGSETWIDEWSSFWVEIYVETADAKGVTEASVDLNYNTDFFTATAIEFSNAFADSGIAVVDDVTGVVTALSGTANSDNAGNHRKTLLARVKFESLEQDDVSINFEDKFIGPHALGLSLSNVNVNLADDIATNIIVGDAPETDLWAIAYDVNDDDVIDFQDLVQLVAVYGENVLDADSPYVWALDFDKSGAVNFEDLTFFVNNYGVAKGGDQEVIYPANFLQRWYGKTTDIIGDSTIDEVMDIALGMWQDALGLEQPLDIQLVITDLGGTQLGAGQITAVDDAGLPIAGIVTLDDDAAGLGWYSDVDTTAFGGTELEGGVAYTADSNSDAAGHYDLLTVLLHEIGHVAGFTRSYAPFDSHIEVGVGGTLMFVGSGFEATLTDDGLHLDETIHAGDVMNATLSPGVRKLPSELDALILQTAHETATNGNFEIQVGVNAPLLASLPLVVEPLETPGSAIVSDISEQVLTTVEPLVALDPIVVDVSNSLTNLNETVLPQLDLALNRLNLKLSVLDQTELDLTVLEDLSEKLQNDLYQNGLSIVGHEKFNTFADSDLDDADLDLPRLDEQLEVGFDDVFSNWVGPIL